MRRHPLRAGSLQCHEAFLPNMSTLRIEATRVGVSGAVTCSHELEAAQLTENSLVTKAGADSLIQPLAGSVNAMEPALGAAQANVSLVATGVESLDARVASTTSAMGAIVDRIDTVDAGITGTQALLDQISTDVKASLLPAITQASINAERTLEDAVQAYSVVVENNEAQHLLAAGALAVNEQAIVDASASAVAQAASLDALQDDITALSDRVSARESGTKVTFVKFKHNETTFQDIFDDGTFQAQYIGAGEQRIRHRYRIPGVAYQVTRTATTGGTVGSATTTINELGVTNFPFAGPDAGVVYSDLGPYLVDRYRYQPLTSGTRPRYTIDIYRSKSDELMTCRIERFE